MQGTERGLAPYMLASHLDVVPVQEELWTHSPFLGSIIQDAATNERVIWGRGAIDDKGGVIVSSYISTFFGIICILMV